MTKIILPNCMVIARVEHGSDDDQKLVGKIVRSIGNGYGDAVFYLEEISDEEQRAD